MPRPPAKRNRLATKATSVSTEQSAKSAEKNEIGVEDANNGSQGLDTSHSPPTESLEGAAGSAKARQTRSRTPMAKVPEQAIESSPLGERVATGSRPPTRARGYSSTLSLAGRKGDMSSRIPGTPGYESSVLSNFRRRPRQPSILQMMQADDGSSDFDDDDDFLGGLVPEDESTPLNLSRGKSLLIKHAATSASEPSLPSSSSSRKRKRLPEVLQVPQSPLGVVEDTPSGSPLTAIDDGVSDVSVDIPSPLESPETFSQTMAPPVSSSSPASPEKTVSEPAKEHSPLATAARRRKPSKKSEDITDAQNHLSTAALQEKLLPRRRQRQRKRRGGEFEVPSDDSEDDYPEGMDQDDDELSYMPSKKLSRSQRKQTETSKAQSNSRAQLKPTDKENRKKKETNTQSTNQLNTKEKITYSRPSRPSEPDKENQPMDASSPLSSALDSDAFDSDTLSVTPKPPRTFISEELRVQAKKFAEIDQWEMEFEDVASASQDSPSR